MSRFLPALRERMQALTQGLPDERLQELAQRVLVRADRVFDQLEATAKVLDKVARTELALLEKLEPIVDDLGRLVRLQLDEARRRISPTTVIDLTSDEQRELLLERGGRERLRQDRRAER